MDNSCPYRKTEGAYPLYLDDTIGSVLTEQQCQRTCTNYRKFNCRSLSFYPAGSQCFISGDDKGTQTDPCGIEGQGCDGLLALRMTGET